MYSCIKSGCPLGIDGMLVSVESDIGNGLPGLSMVGYLASSVREAGDRVRTALKNSGYGLPPRRITVSLSPADIRKDGAGFDLAIAVALLCCMEELPREGLEEYMFLGELGLDGSVREIRRAETEMDYFATFSGTRFYDRLEADYREIRG